MMPALKLTVWLVLIAVLSACGWQLRGAHQQSVVSELNLLAADRYSPLTLALLETMQQQAIDNDSEANLQLILGRESLRKRTVAVTSIGSPSQYEMSLSVEYQYRTGAENEAVTLPRTMTVQRAFDFDPNNTVAKNQEENALVEEMRRELALRVLQLAPAAVDYGQTEL